MSSNVLNPLLGNKLAAREQDNFTFKSCFGDSKIRVFKERWNPLPSPRARLLDVASSHGLLAAAGPSSVVFALSQPNRNLFTDSEIHAGASVKDIVSICEVPASRPISVTFSVSGQYFFLAKEGNDVLEVYNVADILNANVSQPLRIPLPSPPVELFPRPGQDDFLGVVLQDFTFILLDLRAGAMVKTAQGGDFRIPNVSAASWSIKGQRIILGFKDATIGQFDDKCNVKESIPVPKESLLGTEVSDLLWLNNNIMFIVYSKNQLDTDSTEVMSEYYIAQKDESNPQAIQFSVFDSEHLKFYKSVGCDDRFPHRHFISRLRFFEPQLHDAIVISANAASEILIVLNVASWTPPSKPSRNPDFSVVSYDQDYHRISFPVSDCAEGDDDNYMDALPIGMCFDLSPTELVPKPCSDVDSTTTPLPALLALSHCGEMKIWWACYQDAIQKGIPYHGLVSVQSEASKAPSSSGTQDQISSLTSSLFKSSAMGNANSSPFANIQSTVPNFNLASSSGSFGASQPSQASPFGVSQSFEAPAVPTAPFQAPTPFGAPAATATPFGAPAATATLFGASATTTTPFGASVAKTTPFGAPAATATPFGAPPPFGQPSNAGDFGSASTTSQTQQQPFASKPSSLSGSAFGIPSQQPASGALSQKPDGPDSKPAGSGFGSLFSSNSGPLNVSSTSTTSIFGSKPPLGTFQPSAPFGASTNLSSQKGSFGLAATSAAAPKGPFGLTNTASADQKSPFGSLTTDQTTKSLFGSASTDSEGRKLGAFGILPSSSQSGLFGKNPSQPAPPSGVSQAGSQGPFGLPSLASLSFGSSSKPTEGTKPGASSVPSFGFFGFSSSLKETTPLGSQFESGAQGSKPVQPQSSITEITNDADDDHGVQNASDNADKNRDEDDDSAMDSDSDVASDSSEELDEDFEDGVPESSEEEDDTSKISNSGTGVKEEEEEVPRRAPGVEDRALDAQHSPSKLANKTKPSSAAQNAESSLGASPSRVTEPKGRSRDVSSIPDSPGSSLGVVSLNTDVNPSVISFGSSSPPHGSTSHLSANAPSSPVFAPSASSASQAPAPVARGLSYMSADDGTSTPPRSKNAGSFGAHANALKSDQLSFTPQPPLPVPRPHRRAGPSISALPDAENAEVQKILAGPVVPTLKLDEFVSHKNYALPEPQVNMGDEPSVEVVTSHIENIYRDINSMVDTLGLNSLALKRWIAAHDEWSSKDPLTVHDLERDLDRDFRLMAAGKRVEHGWVLGDLDYLHGISEDLNERLKKNMPTEADKKLSSIKDLKRGLVQIQKTMDTINSAVESLASGSPLSSGLNLKTQQTLTLDQELRTQALRQMISKFFTLLTETEKQVSMVRARLTFLSARLGGNLPVPTADQVEGTIEKMLVACQDRRNSLDLLSRQLHSTLQVSDEGDLPETPIRNEFKNSVQKSTPTSLRKSTLQTGQREMIVNSGEGGVFGTSFADSISSSFVPKLQQSFRSSSVSEPLAMARYSVARQPNVSVPERIGLTRALLSKRSLVLGKLLDMYSQESDTGYEE